MELLNHFQQLLYALFTPLFSYMRDAFQWWLAQVLAVPWGRIGDLPGPKILLLIATAGIVEGFLGAGARGSTIIVAAFAAMVSGGIALGGAKFSEEAAERDAERALIEEERQQLTVLPHEELTELAEHYRTRGVSPDLAAQVAAELSAHDALAAHVVAEHGIDLAVPRPRPVVVATTAGLAFAIGAAVPLLTALLAPHDLRAAVTFLAVALSLCVTSYIVARAGGTAIGRTIARTVVLGILTMTITVIGGSFFTP